MQSPQPADSAVQPSYRYCEPGIGFFGFLNLDPTIVCVVYLENLEYLLRAWRDRPVDYLLIFYWQQNHTNIGKLSQTLESWQKKYPLARFHCLANSQVEADLLRDNGFHVIDCNQNALVDERWWCPDAAAPTQVFDAMFDAQLAPFKRLELAAAVPRLALVSYRYEPKFKAGYAQNIAQILKSAHWFNHPLEANFRWLNPEDVIAAYRQCRVGLCLSAIEGACYASIQYLLMGLPVVSTPSRGGRDTFFNAQNSLIVEPNPTAVRDAVATWIERAPSPEAIRAATLPKVQEHRRNLVTAVNEMLVERGAVADFEQKWPDMFFNKLVVWKPYDLAIRSVEIKSNLAFPGRDSP